MSTLNDVIPLSQTLQLLPRETALSFASRLAAFSGCQSVQQFCLDFGLSLAKLKSGDEETVGKLAVLGRADPAELMRWSARFIRGRQKVINSEIVDVTKASSRLWSFCPQCGLEDIAAHPELPIDIAVYGRAEGQTTIIRTCPKHKIKLRQYAVKSKYQQADLGNFIGRFMADIGAITSVSREPGPLEIYAHARLTGSYHPAIDALDSLELWQVVSLTRALGASVKGERGRLEQLDAEALEEVETLGFLAWSGGHNSLVDACRKMRETHWHDNARDGCLHRVGVALRGFQLSLGISTAASTLANAAFVVFPFKKGQLLFGMPCPETVLQLSKNARQELGIGKTVWDAFMTSNPPWVVFRGRDALHTIVDVAQARFFFRGQLPFVSLRSAANRFNINERDLWRLVAAGQITPVSYKALKSVTPVYSLPAIERAISLIATVVEPKTAANDNEISEGFMSLASISKTYAIEVGVIQKLIGTGQTGCIRASTTGNLNDTILVNANEVVQRVLNIDSPMTVQQVAEMIRLEANSVRLLAADGILPSTGRPWRGGINYTFRRLDVEAFQNHYITRSEIMERGLRYTDAHTLKEVECPGWRRSKIWLFLRSEFDQAA